MSRSVETVTVSLQGIVKIPLPERAAPAILLKAEDGRALAILLTDLQASCLEDVLAARPPPFLRLTLDAITALGARIGAVTVHRLEGLDFLARIELRVAGEPSVDFEAPAPDAIGLALLCSSSIRVSPEVMEEAATDPPVLRGSRPQGTGRRGRTPWPGET